VSAEGSTGAWHETPDAKPEHWDEATKLATERAVRDHRNYVIRYVEGDSARVVATAQADSGEIVFPKFYASPPMQRDRELDAMTLWLYDTQRAAERDAIADHGRSVLDAGGWIEIARAVLDVAPPWISDAARAEYLRCNGLR
jgi:hypothetical protein